MGTLVFGMMQSLDGYVAGAPGSPPFPPPLRFVSAESVGEDAVRLTYAVPT